MPSEGISVTGDPSGNFRYKMPHDYRVVELPLVTRAARWQLLFRGHLIGTEQGERLNGPANWSDTAATERAIKIKALIDEHQAKIQSGEIKASIDLTNLDGGVSCDSGVGR